MSTSTHLLLPYVLAAQAQKHVTVNEALRLLDGLVQLAVLDRHLTTPPASPADGARYIVAAGATGAWAGWDLNVAYRVDGAWMRLVPRPGWQAWIVDEASFLAWDGSAWNAAGLPAFFSDAVFELAHDADPTRRAVFDLAAIAAGAVRSFALPNVSTELAGLSGAQTFDGDKTFAGELTARAASSLTESSGFPLVPVSDSRCPPEWEAGLHVDGAFAGLEAAGSCCGG